MNGLNGIWWKLTALSLNEYGGHLDLSTLTRDGSMVGSGFPVLLKLYRRCLIDEQCVTPTL